MRVIKIEIKFSLYLFIFNSLIFLIIIANLFYFLPLFSIALWILIILVITAFTRFNYQHVFGNIFTGINMLQFSAPDQWQFFKTVTPMPVVKNKYLKCFFKYLNHRHVYHQLNSEWQLKKAHVFADYFMMLWFKSVANTDPKKKIIYLARDSVSDYDWRRLKVLLNYY